MRSLPMPSAGNPYSIRPCSPWPETLAVSAAVIVIIALMALRFLSLPADRNPLLLKPYQQRIQDLDASEQLIYRSLQAGVADVVDLLDHLGQWPEVNLLEQALIPPFAPGYLPPPMDEIIWISYDGGTWVDYLGHDVSGRSKASYILRLIDLHGGYHPHPHPGVDYDPELDVAVQVWRYPGSQRPYPGERLPEAGWTWTIDANDGMTPISSSPPAETEPS